MKILILGSVALPVPPPKQGGTERIAYFQAIGLAKRGHQVTLVAARGSRKQPEYTLVEIGGGDTVTGSSLSVAESVIGAVEGSRKLRKEAAYLAQVEQFLFAHGHEYDVIINNMRAGESIFLPIVGSLRKKMLNVMHLPVFPELAQVFKEFRAPVITISNAQRRDFPDLDYAGTVYNAVDLDEYPFSAAVGEYLLMMGSIAPHKNQKAGIETALKLGLKLVMAGKIGNVEYYEKEIKPLIDGTQIIHEGELGMERKIELYKNARALLFPILWEEPFGLVMIEAMACGTPVVAYRRGAIPEVVEDRVTGFIVDTEDQMIEKTGIVGSISREKCRKHVEEHFTVGKMIDSLEETIRKVVTS